MANWWFRTPVLDGIGVSVKFGGVWMNSTIVKRLLHN